jgi:hypothetical protein
VLWWTRHLLLRRTHPWPHRDGVGLGIVEGGSSRGASAVVAGVAGAVALAFPLPLTLTLAFVAIVGVGAGGEGPPEDMAVPAATDVEAAAVTEGALLLRARSRTRRHVPGPSSGSARSPRVQGRCRRCGRRGMTAIT